MHVLPGNKLYLLYHKENNMKTLLLLFIGFGSFVGACSLMSWGPWYTLLAIVTFIGNLYCIVCTGDDEDKK